MPLHGRVRRRLAVQANCHVSAVLLVPELQGDLDRAPVGFERLVQEQTALLESLLHHCAHHGSAASSPSESGMCDDTRISADLGPRRIAYPRLERFPMEVTLHVMLDLIGAARLPPTRTAFSTELIDRSGIVRPDEPDVRTAGRTEPNGVEAAQERGPDQTFELTAEQPDEQGLVQQLVRFAPLELLCQVVNPAAGHRAHCPIPMAKAPQSAVAAEPHVGTD